MGIKYDGHNAKITFGGVTVPATFTDCCDKVMEDIIPTPMLGDYGNYASSMTAMQFKAEPIPFTVDSFMPHWHELLSSESHADYLIMVLNKFAPDEVSDDPELRRARQFDRLPEGTKFRALVERWTRERIETLSALAVVTKSAS